MSEEPEQKISKGNQELFERQKKMLEEFAERGAISKEYCEQEIRILTEKMKPEIAVSGKGISICEKNEVSYF